MALFGSKKQQHEQQPAAAGTDAGSDAVVRGKFVASEVLRKPRITEKASHMSERNVYVFEVDPRANKSVIKRAVRELYNVTPVKVNTLPVPAKSVFSRGIRGRTARGKKAYVHLKAGENINV